MPTLKGRTRRDCQETGPSQDEPRYRGRLPAPERGLLRALSGIHWRTLRWNVILRPFEGVLPDGSAKI